MSSILIMAGGTGGHIMPALAVARELLNRGVKISWIGANRGLEATIVPQADIELDVINVKGMRQSGLVRKLSMTVMLVYALQQCFSIFRKRQPGVVLGMGGFVSGPGGLVAAMLKVPLIVHEQNTVAGLTNRWLSRFSYRVLTGFPEAEGIKKFNCVGNPVRNEIRMVPAPGIRLGNRTGPLRVLVMGGSQGAQVFNRYMAQQLQQCAVSLKVRHQCGRGNREPVESTYRKTKLDWEVQTFVHDMASAYEWSDVVICRSGAMTVSEICAAGAVGIFVPYPHAVDDHQTKNANYLVSQNAAYMVPETEFVTGQWTALLVQSAANRAQLAELGDRALKLAKSNATTQVVDYCLEALHA